MEKKSDKKGEPILNKERINTTNKKQGGNVQSLAHFDSSIV